MKKTFVFVMNIPSPYRIHLLDAMWRQLKERGLDMHVHFMAKGHKGRPKSWLNPKIDFPHTYWRDYGFGEFHFNPGMLIHLLINQPGYLFCTSPYDTFTGVALMLWCGKSKRIAWQETNTKTPGRLDGFVGWFKRKVLTSCQFIGVPGQDAIKQLAMQQARTKKKIPPAVILPNLIDESKFKPRSQFSCDIIPKIRYEIGICEDDCLCIIPARLIAVKGLLPLVGMLRPEWLCGWKILIVGQGPLKDGILVTAKERHVEKFIEIKDYIAYDEMPYYYAAADMMMLPSIQDMNPLSVVEALFAGLPIALSNRVGNIEEAVTDGRNGWVLPVNDRDAFAAKLKEIFSTPKNRLAEMGKLSKNENAQFWNTKSAIARFLDEVLG